LNHDATAKEAQRKHFNKNTADREFQRGDKVYLTRPHKGQVFQKFQPDFEGPYVITQIHDGSNVTIRPMNPSLRRNPVTVHQNRLKQVPGLLQFYNPPPQGKTALLQPGPPFKGAGKKKKAKTASATEDDHASPEPSAEYTGFADEESESLGLSDFSTSRRSSFTPSPLPSHPYATRSRTEVPADVLSHYPPK